MKPGIRKTRGIGLAALLLLAGGLLLNGCESDATAPRENLPPPTAQEAAQQAALVAVSAAKVGPKLVTFNGTVLAEKELGVYPYTFPEGGNITGSIMLEFFTGGPTGTHSAWGDADYGLLYSPGEEMVTASVDLGGGVGPIFGVSFDLHGDINQAQDTATVSGTGTFVTGDISDDFSLTNVVVQALSGYPEGGSLTLKAGSHEVVVTYDGSSTAGVAVNAVAMFTVDLDTGILSPVID